MQNNDLISRSALLADLQEYLNQEVTEGMSFTDMGEGIDLAMERVKDAPAVDAEPVRHGWWIPVLKSDIFGKEYEDGHRCSECGGNGLYSCADYIAYDELYNYCPHCGAKMDGDDNEAD